MNCLSNAIHRYARWASVGCFALTTLVACAQGDSTTSKLPLVKVADVPLTGRASRWDYASVDTSRHLLFLAHMGDDKVTVFDTQANRVVADIPGLSDVHGVLAVPELGKVYATATGTDELAVIDIASLKVIARVPTGRYPDGIAYAPDVHKLYVSNEYGGTDTVVDALTNKSVATIPIGRKVGNSQYDPVSHHIWVNEQSRHELIEISPDNQTVVSRTSLPGADGNHGLYVDGAARLAYIACEDNHRLLVFDLDKKQVISSLEVGEDPDVLAFDTDLAWLYVASESGVVSLFKRQDRTLTKLGEETLGPNAHVVAVDPTTHRAYFPLKNLDGKSQLRITQPQP